MNRSKFTSRLVLLLMTKLKQNRVTSTDGFKIKRSGRILFKCDSGKNNFKIITDDSNDHLSL